MTMSDIYHVHSVLQFKLCADVEAPDSREAQIMIGTMLKQMSQEAKAASEQGQGVTITLPPGIIIDDVAIGVGLADEEQPEQDETEMPAHIVGDAKYTLH
jgi:hypothetical protein